MRELKTSTLNKRSQRWMRRYVRRNIDYAFRHGAWVSLRHQMRQLDNDSIVCPRCWSVTNQRAQDPNCPMCMGSAWVHPETMDGYRPRELTRAHIGEIPTEWKSTPTGVQEQFSYNFWLAYDKRQVRDGDLIALVQPEDLDNPSFLINERNEYTRDRMIDIMLFEVVKSEHPTLHPGDQSMDSPMIMAQQVQVATVAREAPEWNVNMGANYPLSSLLNLNPLEYFGDENLMWLDEGAYA